MKNKYIISFFLVLLIFLIVMLYLVDIPAPINLVTEKYNLDIK